MNIEVAAAQLEALGNLTRLQVYRELVRAGRAGLSVRQLQERAGIAAAPSLSHHLRRLMGAGLVGQERQATTLICRVTSPGMDALIEFLSAECRVEGLPMTQGTDSAGREVQDP